MSDERDSEQAGAPVEQTEVTDTQVHAAVERAAAVPPPAEEPAAVPEPSAERPIVAPVTETPNASHSESATEIFAAHTPTSGTALQQPAASEAPATALGPQTVSATPATTPAPPAPTTSAPPLGPTVPGAAVSPERDGEIRISADHPMAALYMQTPAPPTMKGNRGAGVLIALLSTVVFALVYAGVLAIWLAPNFPPSRFLDDGLLPWVLNWGFAAAVSGFLLGFVILVLIVGRAGWWAYVLGGLFVAAFTWVVSLLGFALNAHFEGVDVNTHPYVLLVEYGLFFPVIAAGLVAREVAVWFGAWIGSRGRKVKRENAEAIAEYERTLTEVQAKRS